MNEIATIENLYLLLGEIPKERMSSIATSPIDYIMMRDEEEYLKSCFYQKGQIKGDGIIFNSCNNDDSAPHYYFSYDASEEANIRSSFISMQEFLASATYINRRFKITEEALSEALGGAIPDNIEETPDREECFLICALGDKVLIKKDSFFTSGYEVIDINQTPFKSTDYVFTSDIETTNITPQEIIEGIKSDLKGDIMDSPTTYTP